MKKSLLILAFIASSMLFAISSFSQTLYVPNGTSGIGTSANTGETGIMTSNPGKMLELYFCNTTGSCPGTNTSSTILPTIRFNYTCMASGIFNKNAWDIENDGTALYFKYGTSVTTPVTSPMVTFLNNGNGVGIGTTTPLSKIGILGNASIGATYGNIAAPTSGLIVEGNVGIGTATPARTLHVQTTQTNGGIRVTQTSLGFSALELFNSTTGGHNYAIVSTGAGNGEGAGNFGIYDYTATAYRMFINNVGNVGIGADLTQNVGNYKLIVEGKVAAREFVATLATNWPDFVFSNEYKLMPLTELENYVNTNKHLPDVPSSNDVSQKGVNLGEMNSTLLQKVEELTKYIIEQNKQLIVQNKQLIDQNNKIENLQKEVDTLKNK